MPQLRSLCGAILREVKGHMLPVASKWRILVLQPPTPLCGTILRDYLNSRKIAPHRDFNNLLCGTILRELAPSIRNSRKIAPHKDLLYSAMVIREVLLA